MVFGFTPIIWTLLVILILFRKDIIHGFGSTWAHEFRVNLVESIEVPTLNVGDTVIINDVPACEKTASNGVWVSRMRYRMGKTFTVDKFINHDEYGPLVKLDGLWFRTYHLEKINDFDII